MEAEERAATVSENASIADAGPGTETVVIIGASYVRAWPVEALGGMRVVNKGVDGRQSFEVLGRFESDVISIKPQAVVIWGFINDIHRTPTENIAAAMTRARESIAELVGKAKQHGIEPVLATEVTIRGKDDIRSLLAGWLTAVRGRTSYQQYVNGHVLEGNRWIREYAADNEIRFLDFERLLSDDSGVRKKEFATEDGTHISAAAYEKLTAHAGAVFEAWGTR